MGLLYELPASVISSLLVLTYLNVIVTSDHSFVGSISIAARANRMDNFFIIVVF